MSLKGLYGWDLEADLQNQSRLVLKNKKKYSTLDLKSLSELNGGDTKRDGGTQLTL